MAKEKIGFPLILGGHDHDPFLEEIDDCVIVKTGMDAKNIAVIEIIWNSTGPGVPVVKVVLKDSDELTPDPQIQLEVDQHKEILVELEKSNLCRIPSNKPLSSIGMRVKQTSVGTFLCSVIRNELNLNCCLIGAGCIRGNQS